MRETILVRRQRHRWLLALSITLMTPLTAGCSGGAYLKAADSFASAASTSATTLEGAADFNHRLCARRARLDYLQNRLMGTNTADRKQAGQRLYWDEWFATFRPGVNGPTWDEQCKATQNSDALLAKALTALSAYASALAKVTGEDYSGADIGSLVSDVDSLAAAIPGAPSAATSALKALGGSSTAPGPVGQLGGALKQAYAAKQVKDIAKNAHPAVHTILVTIGRYLDAESAVESQWEHETRVFLNSLDTRLTDTNAAPSSPRLDDIVDKPGEHPAKAGRSTLGAAAPPPVPPPVASGLLRPDPIQLLEFVQFAETTMKDVEATGANMGAILDTLKNLAQAEQSLVNANGNDNEVSALLGFVAQILGDVATVQNAIKGGRSQ